MPPLNRASLAHVSAPTVVPAYDRSAVSVGIVHIGVGGFHRSHQAVYLDSLLAQDPAAAGFGICGVSLLPHDRRIVDVMNAQDTLYTLVVRYPDGSQQARVIGSVVRHLFAPGDPEAVLAQMSDPAVRIVSLTITEGGYGYRPADGTVDLRSPDLDHDRRQPGEPRTAFGYLVEALRRRHAASVPPFTVLSCDNIRANGAVTRRVVTALAAEQDPDFGAWVAAHVAFPNTMVDRITPRTSADDRARAAALTGLDDAWPVTCEPFTQWVIEDDFPTGRPDWHTVGAQFVDDVLPYELMKIRLLNAGHQTIAYPGRLLGHRFGHEACADPTVRRLLRAYHAEARGTLPVLPGTSLSGYCDSLVERFGNAHIGDTIDRLTTDSSTALPNHLLPVVRDVLDAGSPATAGITVIACWARHLEGRDDAGEAYQVNDPRAADLQLRASRHDDDPLAAVRDNSMFSGLAGRPEFEQTYTTALTAIRTHGTRAALDVLLAQIPQVAADERHE